MYRIGGWTAKHGISGSNITLAYSGMPDPPSPGETTELVGMVVSFVVLAITFGPLLAIAFHGLQIVSAGVVLPLSTAPGFIRTLGEVMHLSIAMRGAQSLISGGSTGALAAVLGVAVSGLIGLILLAIAVQRGRRISTPPEMPAA